MCKDLLDLWTPPDSPIPEDDIADPDSPIPEDVAYPDSPTESLKRPHPEEDDDSDGNPAAPDNPLTRLRLSTSSTATV